MFSPPNHALQCRALRRHTVVHERAQIGGLAKLLRFVKPVSDEGWRADYEGGEGLLFLREEVREKELSNHTNQCLPYKQLFYYLT